MTINGLLYLPHYLNNKKQQKLISIIDAQDWMDDLKRRVQHYGYRYDYRRRTVTPEMHLGKLPDWLYTIAYQIHSDRYMPTIADQCIINEYEPGQGISAHVDCEPCFGDVVCSLSLGSPCVMVFEHLQTGRRVEQKLEPGSMVVMSGEARYDWTHAIPARKTDVLNGEMWQRDRRISITYRAVILN